MIGGPWIGGLVVSSPWRHHNWRPLGALPLEAFAGLIIGGSWRLYNYRHFEALSLEAIGGLIIAGPWDAL